MTFTTWNSEVAPGPVNTYRGFVQGEADSSVAIGTIGDGFAGSVVHSSEYGDGAAYGDQDVLVIGCGNSGAEITLDLLEHGARPAMVVRGPTHVVPRDALGLPSQQTSILLGYLPVAVSDAISMIAGKSSSSLSGNCFRPGPQEPRQMTSATQPFPIGDAVVPQEIDIAPEEVALINQGRIPVWFGSLLICRLNTSRNRPGPEIFTGAFQV